MFSCSVLRIEAVLIPSEAETGTAGTAAGETNEVLLVIHDYARGGAGSTSR